MTTNRLPLLTFNCHEAWIYQLSYLGLPLEIIDGLPGRYCKQWDTCMRPVPEGARLVTKDEALVAGRRYCCIVAHNLSDLMDAKSVLGPRVLVLHETIEQRMGQEGKSGPPGGYLDALERYLDWVGGVVVAVSDAKRESWGLKRDVDVVHNSARVDDYLPWQGGTASGLRVANQIMARRECFMWDLHERAFEDLPVRIVGFNPDMPGVGPSRCWDELKELLSQHRFFIHTTTPHLEDGFSMAVVEAMAAGMPIVGTRHPNSPIVHGVSGYLSDDAAELRGYAERLLADRAEAQRLGEAARETARELFSSDGFAEGFAGVIGKAETQWRKRRREVEASMRHERRTTQAPTLAVLAEQFRRKLMAGDAEGAVAQLDAMMAQLGLPRDMELTSMNDLIATVARVHEALVTRGEDGAAGVLQRIAAQLSASLS